MKSTFEPAKAFPSDSPLASSLNGVKYIIIFTIICLKLTFLLFFYGSELFNLMRILRMKK